MLFVRQDMKDRAVVKKNGDWWTGWFVDLHGVNAQEKTRVPLIESLRIGAEEMLATDLPFTPGGEMIAIEVGGTVLSTNS